MKIMAGRAGLKWVLGVVGVLVLLCGIAAMNIWILPDGYMPGSGPTEAVQVAQAGEYVVGLAPAEPLPAGGLPVAILMYHHVGPLPPGADPLRRDLTVSAQDFETQVVWLMRQGYVSVTLADVYRAVQREIILPAKSVVFTFDDGYADVFQEALPVLTKYNMGGSFAVVPDFLDKPDYATWDMVVEAKKAGMEIVSHTDNHFDGSNPKFDKEYIRENLAQSLEALERRLGPIPRVLVYPYGHFTPEYTQVAQEVGFVMALTTRYGRLVDQNDLMRTPRVRVHGAGTMEKFAEAVTGIKHDSSKTE